MYILYIYTQSPPKAKAASPLPGMVGAPLPRSQGPLGRWPTPTLPWSLCGRPQGNIRVLRRGEAVGSTEEDEGSWCQETEIAIAAPLPTHPPTTTNKKNMFGDIV